MKISTIHFLFIHPEDHSLPKSQVPFHQLNQDVKLLLEIHGLHHSGYFKICRFQDGAYHIVTYTLWKINMEPTNHPFRKENDLPNLHDYVPC